MTKLAWDQVGDRLYETGVSNGVLYMPNAGAAAWFPDEAYEQAGATVLDADELRKTADVLVSIGQPDAATENQ